MEEFISGNLSREEILHVFEQRHLPLEDMNNLSHSELVRVYKTFCLPLSQRHTAQRHRYAHSQQRQRYVGEAPVSVDETKNYGLNAMDIDLQPANDDLIEHLHLTSTIAEKRRPSFENFIEDYQYLSRATKRIKICMS
uniref:Ashwin n=2 Tax=Stomoxys calcitrans TaxID=35570 RepID=A0A1I8NRB1_STOCA